MNTRLDIKDILITVTDRHLALVNPTGQPAGYQIIEYVRAHEITAVTLATGSLVQLLKYATQLTN